MSGKEEGMKRAEAHANVDWKDAAERRLIRLTKNKRFFTSDDILSYLDNKEIKTHDNRALGGIMNRWVRQGYISPIGFQNSSRPSRHGGTVRLWKSNLYKREEK